MQVVDGVMGAMDLWSSCTVPSLLTNCSVWSGKTEDDAGVATERDGEGYPDTAFFHTQTCSQRSHRTAWNEMASMAREVATDPGY